MLDLVSANIKVDDIKFPAIERRQIKLGIARFDLIHPVVSGNKLFKLYYYLKDALAENKSVTTFGGYFSNHLAATAYACKELGIKCKGFVNGEKPENLSATLLHCMQFGMDLEFISREEYRKIKYNEIKSSSILIPEGGYSEKGKQGAALMYNSIKDLNADFICLSVGSATTLSGILSVAGREKVLAFPAIKNMTDIPERLKILKCEVKDTFEIINDYHFGGFSKTNRQLLQFMQEFYDNFSVKTDIVYTGKMMYGISDLINKNYFPDKSKIVVIHSGGLQGNPENLFL